MTPQETETIAAAGARLTKPVDIRVFLCDDPRSNDLREFCRRLSRIAPHIRTAEDTDEADPLPSIGIGRRLRYRGVPLGRELEPFLEALAFLHTGIAPVAPDLPGELLSLDSPADLQLFVTPFCGFCPTVLRRLLPLAFGAAPIYLTVTDAVLFPEIAKARRIKSVPTLVLDDRLRWSGAVDMTELGRAAVNRDPAMLSGQTLERILQADGGAYELAGMMHRCGSVFPAFADLLSDERFTVRLAAMVAVEDLLDRDAELVQQVIPAMLNRYSLAADTVRGDFLYLFGQLKATQALPLLQAATADPNEEVREAAAEALEKVNGR